MFKLPLALCGEVIEVRYACSDSVNGLEIAGGYLPGRTTSPWEIASSGRLSPMPWTCFSCETPFLEIEGISGMISARAVGLISAF